MPYRGEPGGSLGKTESRGPRQPARETSAPYRSVDQTAWLSVVSVGAAVSRGWPVVGSDGVIEDGEREGDLTAWTWSVRQAGCQGGVSNGITAD